MRYQSLQIPIANLTDLRIIILTDLRIIIKEGDFDQNIDMLHYWDGVISLFGA